MKTIQNTTAFTRSKQFLLQITAVTIILGCTSLSTMANEFDKRQAIRLNLQQQAQVLTEMRKLLSGTRAIVSAIAVDDMQEVVAEARALGMHMKKKPENSLATVLPKAFMIMGKSLHNDFDRIADDAEKLKNPKHTLRQLGLTLSRCQGCHETYRIDTSIKNELTNSGLVNEGH